MYISPERDVFIDYCINSAQYHLIEFQMLTTCITGIIIFRTYFGISSFTQSVIFRHLIGVTSHCSLHLVDLSCCLGNSLLRTQIYCSAEVKFSFSLAMASFSSTHIYIALVLITFVYFYASWSTSELPCQKESLQNPLQQDWMIIKEQRLSLQTSLY